MTGSNAILAIVVGAIVVIVGFSLWPVLNASSNNLYSYFRDSCADGSGTRFLRGYVEHTGANPASITRTALSGGNWGLYEGYAQSLPSNTDGAFKYEGAARFRQHQGGLIPIRPLPRWCYTSTTRGYLSVHPM